MKVIVIGGGAAGMQAAATLRGQGIEAVIVEREERLGGKLTLWHRLFPTFAPADEVVDGLRRAAEGVDVVHGEAVAIDGKGVTLADGRHLKADAVVVATGYDLFRAELKEEYGYGVYDNVVTTVDIERMLNGEGVRMRDGSVPRRIAFLHCVGSRDEKVDRRHCSRVCCITAVKQAMELRELIPDSEVWSFYMDMRMFGAGWEEMYRRAQEEHGIHFVRGRIAEAGETIDRRVQIKAEDTLIGRPLRMTVDMLVLAVGMGPSANNFGLPVQSGGFIATADPFARNVETTHPGVFVAGTAAAPKTIGETLAHATSAALRAAKYVVVK